jgi:hypothetical protein
VAVFCVTDGTATEDEDNNAAVRLTPEQMGSPPCPAPEDVPVLSPTALSLGDRRIEVDPQVVEQLGHADAALGERLEEVVAAGGQHGFDKVGGVADPIQHAVGSPLVVQVDFDTRSLKGNPGWEDAGLFGAVYVVGEGNDLFIEWQYT